MPRFHYQALNAEQQIIAGSIDAESVQQAIERLIAEGLTVQSIGFAAAESMVAKPALAVRSTTAQDAAEVAPGMPKLLQVQVAALLARATVLSPALRAYSDEMRSGRQRRELRKVCDLLDSGNVAVSTTTLASLPEYWIPLLSAAASSNDPGRVLQEFLDESQRAEELRRQWWRTFAYPVVVACLAIGVFVVLSLVVIPVFRTVFWDFGLELPVFTLAVLTLSEWITSVQALAVLLLLIVIAALLLASRVLTASKANGPREWVGSWFGRSTAVARFARFTAELLEAGLDIPNATRIAAQITRAPKLQRAGWALASQIAVGGGRVPQSVERPLTATVVYALVHEMATASRIRLLKEISSSYSDRVRRRLSWTHSVLGPIAICVMGVGVGALVLALFLPLIDLINNLSG